MWFSASGSAEKPGLAEEKAALGLSVPGHGRPASQGAGCHRWPEGLARLMPPAVLEGRKQILELPSF